MILNGISAVISGWEQILRLPILMHNCSRRLPGSKRYTWSGVRHFTVIHLRYIVHSFRVSIWKISDLNYNHVDLCFSFVLILETPILAVHKYIWIYNFKNIKDLTPRTLNIELNKFKLWICLCLMLHLPCDEDNCLCPRYLKFDNFLCMMYLGGNRIFMFTLWNQFFEGNQ